MVKIPRIQSATPATIRRVNRSIILNLVRLQQPISRIQLSRRTGIFRSSVSAIVDELLRDDLLIEQPTSPKGRGRAPVHLFLNPNGFRVLGISVRRFQTQLSSCGLSGQIGHRVAFRTPDTPTSFLKHLARAVQQIRHRNGASFQEVGISVPGLVNSETGTILLLPSLPNYTGFEIASEVRGLVGSPVSVDNDCNTWALAELWLHEKNAAGLRDFVLLEIADVGVGSGVILNGELYGGHDHTWVGEFGHMIIDPAGPKCSCGRRGCWELYVSDRATWQRYAPRQEFTPARFDRLIALACKGDQKAVKVFLRTAKYLSLGLSNIIFCLNPQRVVVAGRITQVWNWIHPTVETAFSSAKVKISVHPAQSTIDELSLLGAVTLALRKAFAAPKMG